MRRMLTYMAATHTASSSRVHTSVTRISSVGKRDGRAHVPPDLAGVLDDAVAHQQVDGLRYSSQLSKRPGQARARQLLVGGEAVALEAGVLAFRERRGGRQHQQVRQEIARLVHEVDAQLVVLDADVHVHAADDEPAADAGEVAGDRLVAVALGRLLRAPAREGVGGGGDRREAVLGRQLGHGAGAGRRARRPASRGVLCTPVPTSICDFRNSRATWPCKRLLRRIEQGLRHLAHEVRGSPGRRAGIPPRCRW